MHILTGVTLSPRDAERKGLVHETVNGKALDRAMEIAKHLAKHEQQSVASIKRLVRNATAMPLAEGLALERNLFLKLAISDNQVSLPSADHLLDGLNSFLTALTWPEALQRIQTLLKQGLQQDPDFEKRWPEVLGSFLEDQPKRP
jgi:hypothetical protein